MTNGEMIQKVFNCEVCDPIPEDDIIHIIFSGKKDSAIGLDLSWWNAEYKGSTTNNDLRCKQLVDELSKMPPMVLATAYLHAINYTLYGEDVTEKWVTATQNACALEKAYGKGYYDALQRQTETEADVAKKYQKIEEVIDRLKNLDDHTTSTDLLFEIKEIVEDGNNNL